MSTLQGSSILPLINVHGVLGAFSVHPNPSKKEILLDDGCHTLAILTDGSIRLTSPLASANATVYPICNNINTFFSFSRQTGLLRYNDKNLVLTSPDPLISASATSLSVKYVLQHVTDQSMMGQIKERGIECVHTIVGHTHASLFTAMLAKDDAKLKIVQRFSDFDAKLLKVIPLLHESQGKTNLILWVLFETGDLHLHNINLSMSEIRCMAIMDKLRVDGVKDIYCNPYTSEVLLHSKLDILYYLSLREPYTHVELARLHPNEYIVMGQPRTPSETTFFIIRPRDNGLQTQIQWLSISHSTKTCITIAEVIYSKVLLHLHSLDTQTSSQFYNASCLAVHENGDVDLLFALPPPVSDKSLSSKIASLNKEIASLERDISNIQARSRLKTMTPDLSPRDKSSWANTSLTSIELDITKSFNHTHNIQMVTISLKNVYRVILIKIPSSLKLVDAANGISTDLGLLMFLNTSKCEFSLARSRDYLPFKKLILSTALFPSGSDFLFEPSPVYFNNILLDGFEQIVSPSTIDVVTDTLPAVCASVPSTAVSNTMLCSNVDKNATFYMTDKLTLMVRSTQDGGLQISGDSPHLIIQTIASITGQQYSPALLNNTDYCTSLRLEENILRSVRLKGLVSLIESMDYYGYSSLLRDLRLGTEPALAQYSNILLMSPNRINTIHVALVGVSTKMEGSSELALAYAGAGACTSS